MQIFPHNYYHFFNRTNNEEEAFKRPENYLFFLQKYQNYFQSVLTTIAYCLMPTHFHFLVFFESQKEADIGTLMGRLQSSYAKAINKQEERHGSLFQQHAKALIIKDEANLLNLVTYIHQNPVHAGLVKNLEDWVFSSYPDYVGIRKGTLVSTEVILDKFKSISSFVEFSQRSSQVDLKESGGIE
jgi:putative transposase